MIYYKHAIKKRTSQNYTTWHTLGVKPYHQIVIASLSDMFINAPYLNIHYSDFYSK